MKKVSIALRLIAAVIIGQTLFFKFTGAPEAVYIFTTLGVEPWGRLATGAIELLTVILLITPRTVLFGAFLAANTMVGAILSHLLFLGIEVQGDGGTLFGMAIITLVASSAILLIHRKEVQLLLTRLRQQRIAA